MKRFLAGTIVALAFSTSAFAADGAAIYKSKCLACHGVEGKGSAMAPAFNGNPHFKSANDQQISDIILKGRSGAEKMHKQFTTDMPPQKLSDDELKAVVAYVRSLVGEGDHKEGAGDHKKGGNKEDHMHMH